MSNVFKFNDAIDYLNYEFEMKRIKNNRFSLRAWSRQLGYENPAFVSHILKRDRSLKAAVATRFSSSLKLTGNAKRYFEVLVLLGNCKTVEEKTFYFDILEGLRPQTAPPPQSLSVDAFRVIADWYHTAILELIELADFENDAEWIKTRLGQDVPTQTIEKAIARLLKLELIEKTQSGKLKRVKDNSFFLDSQIPNEAIRHFHKQMIDQAKSAIDEQEISERDIRGSMISIRAKDYPKIQEMIKKVHAEFVKYSSRGNGEELYQLNTQFFKVTKRKEEK